MTSGKRSLTGEVQDFLSAPLGDATQFYRLVTIPQIFVFVILMVIGSALGESLFLLLSKISAIFVLFCVHLLVQARRPAFLFVHLVLGMLANVTVLELYTVHAELEPGYALFLPATLSLLAYTLVEMSWTQRLVFSVLALGACVPGAFLAGGGEPDDPVRGIWFLFCFAGLFAPSIFDLLRTREPAREGAGVGPAALSDESRGRARRQEIAVRPDCTRGFEQGLVTLLSQSMRTRLTTLVMLVGVGTLGLSEVLDANDLWSRLGFGAILLVHCVLLFAMGREDRSSDLWRQAFAVVVALLCWWCLFTVRIGSATVPAFGGQGLELHIISPWASQREVLEGPFADLLLVVIIIGVSSIGWPSRLAFGLATVVLLVTFARLPTHRFPLGSLALGFAVAGAVLIQAAHAYVALMAGAAWSGLRVMMRRVTSPADGWEMLAAIAPAVLDARRGVLLSERGNSTIAENGGLKSSGVADPLVRELLRRYRSAEPQCRIVRTRDLGNDFYAPLVDWFKRVPRYLVVLAGGGEVPGERWMVLVPASVTLLLNNAADRERFMTELIRETVEGTLRSPTSEGTNSLEAARAIADREQDFGRAVHAVNNVAQAVSIACERMRKTTGFPQGGLKYVRDIETAVRAVSIDLSDQRLLRELVKITSSAHTERIKLSAVSDDLGWYVSDLSVRMPARLFAATEEFKSLGIEVIGRAYFSAVLRSIVRERAIGRQGEPLEIRLSAEQLTDHVVLRFRDETPVEGARNSEESSDDVLVKAISQFCRLSEALYDFPRTQGEGPWECSFTLKRWVVTPERIGGRGKWALLVDDNPEITNFYQHAVEALGLGSMCAGSVESAMEVVEERGAPTLVVTDIHLGGSTGIELIRALGKRFSESVPIIVVSGESSEKLREEGLDLSRVRHLMKPVSRKRLFSEMRDVLWTAIEETPSNAPRSQSPSTSRVRDEHKK